METTPGGADGAHDAARATREAAHAARGAASRAYGAAVIVVVFVLGVVQGVVGSFQYGQTPAPLIAILLDVAILATCLLCGWGTGRVGGALAPAAGWILAAFFLAAGNHHGSVIITNSAAGKWFLYGGTLAALAGVIGAFAHWLRARPPLPLSRP